MGLICAVSMSESRPETKVWGKAADLWKEIIVESWQQYFNISGTWPHIFLISYIRILIIELLNYGGFQWKWVSPTQP